MPRKKAVDPSQGWSFAVRAWMSDPGVQIAALVVVVVLAMVFAKVQITTGPISVHVAPTTR